MTVLLTLCLLVQEPPSPCGRALCVLAGFGAQDDKAAGELLKKLVDRAVSAKTVHVKASVRFKDGELSIEIKLKGQAMFLARFARDNSDAMELKSDGRMLVIKGRDHRRRRTPGEIAPVLRRCVGDTVMTPFILLEEAGDPEQYADELPEVDEPKWEGTEKVAGTDASVVSYRLTFMSIGRPLKVMTKAWIDPAKLTVLKRELSEGGQVMTESYEAFAYDVEMSDDDFAFQSATSLAAGRANQVARSVELFMRYTGSMPRALGDLAKRPEWLDKDIFWPDGGFWLGATVPDVAYSVEGLTAKVGERTVRPADRRAVVVASERLSKHYSARVQVALVAAAVEAFGTTYSALPRKKADLWQKPEWATVWPEGGFLSGAPADPWGAPLRIITDENEVRVQVNDWRDRAIKITDEERKALEAGAATRLTAAEAKELDAMVEQLRDDDLETREKASAKLPSWGPAVVELLDRRMNTEKDAETLARFKEVRAKIRLAAPAWSAELGALTIRVRGGPASEKDCADNLSQLWKMQANYMVQFGGRAKLMSSKTGPDFWLELSRTTPPLIDASLTEIYVCPGGVGTGGCTYWGPAEDVNTYGDGDPVGMCDDPCHGGDAIILRKSGDVMTYTLTDPIYAVAVAKLRGPKKE